MNVRRQTDGTLTVTVQPRQLITFRFVLRVAREAGLPITRHEARCIARGRPLPCSSRP